MSSPFDRAKETLRHERAISSLRDRTGGTAGGSSEACLGRTGPQVRSYPAVFTVASVRALLRRKGV